MIYIFFITVLTLTLFVVVSLAALDIEHNRQKKLDKIGRRPKRPLGQLDPRQNNGDYHE